MIEFIINNYWQIWLRPEEAIPYRRYTPSAFLGETINDLVKTRWDPVLQIFLYATIF